MDTVGVSTVVSLKLPNESAGKLPPERTPPDDRAPAHNTAATNGAAST
jgi:hypothetical protein